MGEDLVLMVQIFNDCKKISYLNQPLYYYYSNTESITGLQSYDNVSKRVMQLKENVLLIQKYLSGQGLDIKYKDEITHLKIFTRLESFKCKHDARWQQLWNSVFSDLKLFDVLINRDVSIKSKTIYLSVEMGIYRIIK